MTIWHKGREMFASEAKKSWTVKRR